MGEPQRKLIYNGSDQGQNDTTPTVDRIQGKEFRGFKDSR